jgi:hypothetical protein
MMRCGGPFLDAITRRSGRGRLSFSQHAVLSFIVIRPLKVAVNTLRCHYACGVIHSH